MALNPNPMAPRQNSSWRLARLLLTSVLLGACATSPGHPGTASRGDLRLDSESVARARYAGLLRGTTVSTTALAVGSTLVLATPVVLAVFHHNQDKVAELQERLAECARMAEHQVNSAHFGNRPPTRRSVARSWRWTAAPSPSPGPCSWAGRSTTSPSPALATSSPGSGPRPSASSSATATTGTASILETISREKEQQFIKEGCTEKLWGSIKPDIVLHSDYNLLQAALIIDLKFPCPPSNDPTWTIVWQEECLCRLESGPDLQGGTGWRGLAPHAKRDSSDERAPSHPSGARQTVATWWPVTASSSASSCTAPTERWLTPYGGPCRPIAVPSLLRR